MKRSTTEKELTKFLSLVHQNGGNEEELGTIVKAIFLLRKYLPFYTKKEP